MLRMESVDPTDVARRARAYVVGRRATGADVEIERAQ